MEISDVRRRLRGAVEEARRRSAERRAAAERARAAYAVFLEQTAVPTFQMLHTALTGEGHRFDVSTPGDAVRLSSDRSPDVVELSLDTDREVPALVLRSTRGRGRRTLSAERVAAEGDAIGQLTGEDLLSMVLAELVPFIER